MKLLSWTIASALAVLVASSPLTGLEKKDLSFGPADLQPRDLNGSALEARTNDHKPKCRSKKCCESKNLLYNPKTDKCFNPARHPSVANCAYFGKLYNKKKNRCYSPWDHPSKKNCECIGLVYDRKHHRCVKPRHPHKHCPKGQYPVYGEYKKCASCGWCKPYQSGGWPVCTKHGHCTLVCPAGQRVKHSHGLVWCE